MSQKEQSGLEVCSDCSPLNLMCKASDAVTAVASNDLILKCIFTHLPTSELVKHCRLVNQQWNRVATEILKKRRDAYVRVTAETDFVALEECIKNSTDFPFREIDLQCGWKDFAGRPGKWLVNLKLIKRFPHLFRRLRLASYRVPDTVVTVLLSDYFNHIESLTLNPTERNKKSLQSGNHLLRDEYGNSIKLESIKLIAMGSASEGRCSDIDVAFLQPLLVSCPNVERIENFTNAHLHALSSAGKLDVVKSLRVCSCQKDENYPLPTAVETLIITNGNGKGFFEFCGENGMEFTFLQPLLESNQETLRRIEVYSTVKGGNNGDDWPKLKQLTSLKLAEVFYFPPSVEQIFPALQTLQLESSPKINPSTFSVRGYIWKEPLSSVIKLEVLRRIRPEDQTCIARAVPNVRHIFLDVGSFLDLNLDCWRIASCFEHLEACYLSPIELPDTDLDKFFTGIPESNLKDLRKNPDLPIPAPEFIDAVLRKAGESVASLSGLKELVVRFTMSDEVYWQDVIIRKPMSHVALQYGLNMAPADLKIHFLYDHWSKNAQVIKEALLPVSERVTFGHWNANLEYPTQARSLDAATAHPIKLLLLDPVERDRRLALIK